MLFILSTCSIDRASATHTLYTVVATAALLICCVSAVLYCTALTALYCIVYSYLLAVDNTLLRSPGTDDVQYRRHVVPRSTARTSETRFFCTISVKGLGGARHSFYAIVRRQFQECRGRGGGAKNLFVLMDMTRVPEVPDTLVVPGSWAVENGCAGWDKLFRIS